MIINVSLGLMKAMDLLRHLLKENPAYRLSGLSALKHEFFTQNNHVKVEDVGMMENMINFQNELYYFYFIF